MTDQTVQIALSIGVPTVAVLVGILSRAFRGGDAEHLLDPRELHTRPAGGLAERALVTVDRGPAVVGDELGLALAQQLRDRDADAALLAINAGAYSFETAGARHEHEWKIWRDVKLPDGKVILPGVVTHSTNVVEHPELIADRIVRFAEAAGRENVVASTDCGLGGRVHPQIAWAKLDTLVKGAEPATSQLWG